MIAHLLPWDSAHFGYTIAQADIDTLGNGYDYESAITWQDLRDWCESNKVDCLYFAVRPDDNCTITTLETYKAHLTDVRITLTRQMLNRAAPGYPSVTVNVTDYIEESDIPTLYQLVDYSSSRFYYDYRLRPQATKMYHLWVEKSCHLDKVFVARVNGQIAGYITVQIKDTVGQMVLVGVGTDYQNQGVGLTLGGKALQWLKSQGCAQVEVVTQGRNVPALRLYQELGFVTSQVRLFYHWWRL
jgi:ribosomal protein S18 acetylase RimI-like enzyme